MEIDETDPAEELAELLEHLRGMPGDPLRSTAIALSGAIGCEPNGDLYETMKGIIKRRCETVRRIAKSTRAWKRYEGEIDAAIRAFRRMFDFETQSAQWGTTRDVGCSQVVLLQLRLLSSEIRANCRLRIISEAERQAWIEQIDQATGEAKSAGIEGEALLANLETLRAMISSFSFFGRYAIMDQALTVAAEARSPRGQTIAGAAIAIALVFSIAVAVGTPQGSYQSTIGLPNIAQWVTSRSQHHELEIEAPRHTLADGAINSVPGLFTQALSEPAELQTSAKLTKPKLPDN